MRKDSGAGKTRITIRLDADVLAWFRRQVASAGGSYQTAINLALRDYIALEPLEATLRRVVREELASAAGAPPESAYAYGPRSPALVADAEHEGGEYGRQPARGGRPKPRPKGARKGRSGRKD